MSACAQLDVPEEPFLAAPRPPQVGAVLEIASIKTPWNWAPVNEDLWEHLDEQRIDADVRVRLADNGMRMGVVAGHNPSQLLELIDSIDQAYRSEGVQLEIVDHEAAELVESTRRNLRAGQRWEMIASEIRPSESMFTMEEDGSPSGRRYRNAQYLFSSVLQLAPGGAVELKITPELQHGEQHLAAAAVGTQSLTLQHARSRKVFDELRTVVTLHPGEILVATCLPDRPASFGGRCFLAGTGEERLQKLLLVRLVQVQHDGLFDDSQEVAAAPHDPWLSTPVGGDLP